jgi:hypothetical protein
MENEFRFSFMIPKKIDPSQKCTRVYFKSNDYLFHGIKFYSKDSAYPSYMQKTTQFQGKNVSVFKIIILNFMFLKFTKRNFIFQRR